MPGPRPPGRGLEADPAPVLVVGGVVLEGRDDVLALGAADHLGRGVAGQERVLALGLRLAARQRRAVDVHGRAQPLVEPLAAGLGPDHLPVGRASERSNVAASACPDGIAVVPGLRSPSGPSSALSAGTPKLASAAKLPSASWIFWSVLRAASSSFARTSGGWSGFRHGCSGRRRRPGQPRRRSGGARRHDGGAWPRRPNCTPARARQGQRRP